MWSNNFWRRRYNYHNFHFHLLALLARYSKPNPKPSDRHLRISQKIYNNNNNKWNLTVWHNQYRSHCTAAFGQLCVLCSCWVFRPVTVEVTDPEGFFTPLCSLRFGEVPQEWTRGAGGRAFGAVNPCGVGWLRYERRDECPPADLGCKRRRGQTCVSAAFISDWPSWEMKAVYDMTEKLQLCLC